MIGAVNAEIAGHSNVITSIAKLTNNGENYFFTSSHDSSIKVWTLANGAFNQVAQFDDPNKGQITCMTPMPDGTGVIAGTQ